MFYAPGCEDDYRTGDAMTHQATDLGAGRTLYTFAVWPGLLTAGAIFAGIRSVP